MRARSVTVLVVAVAVQCACSGLALQTPVQSTGWVNLTSIGPRTVAAQGSGLEAAPGVITLSWKPPSVPAGVAITGYQLFRSTTPGERGALLSASIAVAEASFTDSSITAGQTYWYSLAAALSVQGGGDEVSFVEGPDAVVAVVAAAPNTVLLHRWMANLELCTLMKKPVDREHDSRCAFSGPGSVDGFLDYGTSLLVDAYEVGCAYSFSATQPRCGAAEGCVGTSENPNGAVRAQRGDVYYSRYNGRCWVNRDGASAWVDANDPALTVDELRAVASNAAGLPPLVLVNQPMSARLCSAATTPGFTGKRRLLRRKEHVAVAAWPAALSEDDIAALEDGRSLPTTGACNANWGDGVLGNSDGVMPSNAEAVPFMVTTAYAWAGEVRSVRTGSTSTRACRSRYGAQDLVGNVSEWESDQIDCDGVRCVGVPAIANPIDPANNDLQGVRFDDLTGGPTRSNLFSSWNRLWLPLAFPVAGSLKPDGAVALSDAQLHADSFAIDVASGVRGLTSGGTFARASEAGRFALNINTLNWAPAPRLGFRCALEVR